LKGRHAEPIAPDFRPDGQHGCGYRLCALTDAWNLPAATIEFFWAAISLYGLVRSLRQQPV
jgi:hypothetical protein